MSILNSLVGTPEKHKIGKVEIEFKPFKLDEMDKIKVDTNTSSEEQMEQSREMIKEFLKKAVPDATEEELGNVSLQYMKEIMDVFINMHKFAEVPNVTKRLKK